MECKKNRSPAAIDLREDLDDGGIRMDGMAHVWLSAAMIRELSQPC